MFAFFEASSAAQGSNTRCLSCFSYQMYTIQIRKLKTRLLHVSIVHLLQKGRTIEFISFLAIKYIQYKQEIEKSRFLHFGMVRLLQKRVVQ